MILSKNIEILVYIFICTVLRIFNTGYNFEPKEINKTLHNTRNTDS